jgi:hypothetical protein
MCGVLSLMRHSVLFVALRWLLVARTSVLSRNIHSLRVTSLAAVDDKLLFAPAKLW